MIKIPSSEVCQVYLLIFFFLGLLWKDVDLCFGYWLKSYNCCGIWGMKFIVRNMVSRSIVVLNILSFWSAARPRMILILTLQSFPRIGVLNVKCPCFPPLLRAGHAVTSYTSHGKITPAHTLQMLLCSSGAFFCSNYRGGWEALRCKGLWGTASFLSWSPEPWKHWGVNVPLSQISCGGATRAAEHGGFGAAGRTAALRSWFSAQCSQRSALRLPVVQRCAGCPLAPGVTQVPALGD